MTEASNDIREALARLGARRGDVVFVHCDLRRLGLVRAADGKIGLLLDAPELLAALRDAVGAEGTIVVPAFSYSWTRGEVFDPAQSPSAMGRFAEHVRGQPDARRSRHPLLSFAACGSEADAVAGADDDFPYGDGSVYAWMVRRDALMLMAGVPYCSLKDHVEFTERVPYRYVKQFNGTTIDGGTARPGQCHHFVRYRRGDADVTLASFLDGLTDSERAAAVRSATFGTGKIDAIRAAEGADLLRSILTADPYRFVSGGYVAPEAFGFLRDACRFRAEAGWTVAASARQIEAGEAWAWQVRADDDVLRRMGYGGETPVRALDINVGGRTWGADICIDAAPPGPADDGAIIGFVRRLVDHPESDVRWSA